MVVVLVRDEPFVVDIRGVDLPGQRDVAQIQERILAGKNNSTLSGQRTARHVTRGYRQSITCCVVLVNGAENMVSTSESMHYTLCRPHLSTPLSVFSAVDGRYCGSAGPHYQQATSDK